MVGDSKGDDIRDRYGVADRGHVRNAVAFGLPARSGATTEADSDVVTGILQVKRDGATLRPIADNSYRQRCAFWPMFRHRGNIGRLLTFLNAAVVYPYGHAR